MASLVAAGALAPLAKKIIPGLKNGGSTTSAKKKTLRKKLGINRGVDTGLNIGGTKLMKKGGRVKGRKRRGRVKR